MHGYLLEVAARSGWNLALRFIGVALVVGGGVADSLSIAMSGCVLIGALIAVLPYSSPETVRRLGVLKSKWLARYLGILIAVTCAAVLGYTEFIR